MKGVYIIRHGPHILQHCDRFIGQSQSTIIEDPGLVPESARYIEDYISTAPFFEAGKKIVVLSGTLQRHAETAELLCETLANGRYNFDRDAKTDKRFNERWFGYYRSQGKRLYIDGEPRNKIADLLTMPVDKVHHSPFFQFEDPHLQITRFEAALVDALRTYGDDSTIVVVTSGGVMRTFARYLGYATSSPFNNLATLFVPHDETLSPLTPILVHPGISTDYSLVGG